ncbi:MAG: exo-alpha-sialidase [Planctomycetota bacterium]
MSFSRIFLAIALAVLPSFAYAEGNLLENGDAEGGAVGAKPPSWIPGGYTGTAYPTDFPLETVASGRNASKAVRIERPADYQWVYAQQLVGIALDDVARYRFTVWLRKESSAGASADLVLLPSAEGSPVTLPQQRKRFDLASEWTEYSISIDLPPAFDHDGKALKGGMRVIVQLYSVNAILIDDASFVREPLTEADRARFKAVGEILAQDVPAFRSPVGTYGGIICALDGTLLAFTSDFGMRRSTDGGKTWSSREPLAISDNASQLSGAIQLSNGTIGVWTESWGCPLYFWKSEDGGATWTKRIEIGPKGAPLAGNVMIEVPSDADPSSIPIGWTRSVYSKAGKHNPPDTKTSLRKVAGGSKGDFCAALALDEADEWAYATPAVSLDRPFQAGDELRLVVAARADSAASFDLYLESWNAEKKAGSRARKRFVAAGDWKDYSLNLTLSEESAGLTAFRLIIQLYTPGAALLIDDCRLERVAPAPDAKVLPVSNPSFELSPVGALVIPCREGHTVHGGLWKGVEATGTVLGERVTVEGHAHAMEMDISFAYISANGGDSWSRSQGDIIIWKDEGLGGMWPCDEPNVAVLKDGRLLMFIRTTLGRLYQTFSTDGGKTWDYPTPTDLPSSYSPCSLKTFPDNEYTRAAGCAGDLLCVWNNVSFEEIRRGYRRGRLSAAVSSDDGKTWTHVRTVDAGGLPPLDEVAPLSEPQMARAEQDLGELPLGFAAVSYPDVVFWKDRVLVKYDKAFKNPPLSMGSKLRSLPLSWFFGGDDEARP